MKMTKKQRKKLRKVQAYMEGRNIQEHNPLVARGWHAVFHEDEDYSYRGGVTKKGKTKFLRT